MSQYRPVKLTVIGSSPAWPNPGGAHAGLLVTGHGRLLLDCGPGVLARLRGNHGANGWPAVDAIVITHFHLDHWGDLVPWVWGTMFRHGDDGPRPALWLPPDGKRRLRGFGAELGREGMFEGCFEVHEYAQATPFEAAGLEVTPYRVPHYRLETYALRVGDGRRTLCYSGDTGPSDQIVEAARDVDLFVCEATLERGDLDGEPRGHLSAEEAVEAFERSGARRLLLTHRPSELATPEGLEVAYDGFELDL
ncbi:MAG: MBL fold metallo-hydrolase [Pseudomonadota bacterium]